MVCPLLVGSGKHLFEDGGQPVPMRLVDPMTPASGVLNLTYQPRAADAHQRREENRP